MKKEEPAKSPPTFTINDLSGLGPFFEQNELPISLRRDANGRVLGEVPASEKAYRLMAEFQSNPTVHILDFLSYQRRLRGRMLDCRDGNLRSEKGRKTLYIPGDEPNGV
ncbi:MAG: hypothetical protein ABSH06_09965 [Thermodesulfobacteriota bacterium]